MGFLTRTRFELKRDISLSWVEDYNRLILNTLRKDQILKTNWNHTAPHSNYPRECPQKLKAGIQDGVMRYMCPCAFLYRE